MRLEDKRKRQRLRAHAEFIRDLYLIETRTAGWIGDLFAVSEISARRFLFDELGVPSRGRGNARGPDHHAYKHGKHQDAKRTVAPDDPFISMADTRNQVWEHRYVMAQMVGRSLRSDETVHHINGDSRDNRPENLELRQGQHGKGHIACCGECGSQNIVYLPLSVNRG